MTNCIESKKSITSNGYSRIKIDGKNIQAHRWAWEIVNGKIPNDKVIDHICINKKCIAVDHLRIVTQQENVMAGLHNIDNRSNCNQGHPFTKENIMIRKSGKRECAECNRVRARNNYHRVKAGA
jgi:hypothetical protein